MPGNKRRLIDVLNEDYHARQDEAARKVILSAQLTPVRGMTQGHIDQVSAWIEKSGMGSLRPDEKNPGKFLFVPAVEVEKFEDLEDQVNALLKGLHGKFRMEPFHDKWMSKGFYA